MAKLKKLTKEHNGLPLCEKCGEYKCQCIIEEEKRTAGAPTKYEGIKTLKKAEQYIKNCVDKFLLKKSKKGRFVVKLPKAEGLALHLGVSRDCLYKWAEQHKEFLYILERINQIQADRVINEALAGNYNPLIAKLLLGKHGYKDRSDLTSDDKPIAIGKVLDESEDE